MKGLEGMVNVKGMKTTLQARLTDMSVEDITENTLYQRILTIEDDQAFEFKVESIVVK